VLRLKFFLIFLFFILSFARRSGKLNPFLGTTRFACDPTSQMYYSRV
jgi:hypothetical protein